MLLNVQTVYSLLQSTLTIEDYVDQAQQLNYQAIGIADENVLHGCYQFYQLAQAHSLKPLIGMKLTLAGLIDTMHTYSFLLYAKNYQGYLDLIILSKHLNQEPIDSNSIYQLLEQFSADLVMIHLGKESELIQALIQTDQNYCQKIFNAWQQIMGQNMYLSLSVRPYNNIEAQHIIDFAQTTGLKIVIGQKVHSLKAEDASSLTILQAIDQGTSLNSADLPYEGPHYLYPAEELEQLYQQMGYSAILQNTQTLINQLNVQLPDKQNYLPKFPHPQHESAAELLTELTFHALKEKGLDQKEDYVERLEYELQVIDRMGFSDYFLIVGDFIEYCRRVKIRVGPGRGSSAGSLVAYLLQITLVDPIEYDLLFERFLNPERHSMPDIDIDIPDIQRQRVIHYVQDKYGADCVAQVITFGTFGAKLSIRDTLRVLNYDQDTLRTWSKLIPSDQNQPMTLTRAYQESHRFRNFVEESTHHQQIFKIAQTIEGLPRNTSTHAAAIVIHDQALETILPVFAKSHQILQTQYTMYDVEAIGLLKMDFLGLRNLTLLDDILNTVQVNYHNNLDINQIPLSDPATLKIFQNADTSGVFQFESSGIRRVLQKVHPESFEDIVAVIALYRPGPMKQIDHFVARKQGKAPITYLHPKLEPILSKTYGIIVYQEQVMQMVRVMAGYSLGEADILRRAMSKKDKNLMDLEENHFIKGAKAQGFTEKEAQEVFSYILAFANYGFNRSHAVVYSLLAYQLAYLKCHYPIEFYACLLRSGNDTNYLSYIQEAKLRLGRIQAPDINQSLTDTVAGQKQLLLGLNNIKGLRQDFIADILSDRSSLGPYRSFEDFLRRLSSKYLKVDYLEPLILTGAFDQLGYNRATLYNNLSKFIQVIEFTGNNLSLFKEMEPTIDPYPEFSKQERQEYERTYLGFTLDPHPLSQYEQWMRANSQYTSVAEIGQKDLGQLIESIVVIQEMKVIRTKRNELMAFAQVGNDIQSYAMVIFPDKYKQYGDELKEGQLIHFRARLELDRRQERQLVLDQVVPLPNLKQTQDQQVFCFIKINDVNQDQVLMDEIKSFIQAHKGPHPVILVDQKRRTYQLTDKFQIDINTQVIDAFKHQFPQLEIASKSL
ncbi:DNA polymerase III subunit alpha [Ignavigranum ruoffiae]|uniref:DNA-directed DNA polymerase n=1 Tax=Ignavigranum ruoffiae TaxID=89093 RepID=A0A1H8ZMS4_9LACT|nr:DNA polymerase III subunit alpha [Ignavigranum ruoffiae]SEP65722.1 DNA polymerase III catalytic subunit, DnaE type [Ignavigranum ruoffiae]